MQSSISPHTSTLSEMLSLVICTRNRAAQLSKCLRSLERLKPGPSWELIVVDNGSSDETPALLAGFSGRVALRTIQEPLRGLARARNRGWRAASGSIVAFTDDDCYPDPDFISAISATFAESGSIGFAGGRVLLHDPDDFRITIKESAVLETFPPHSFIPTGAIHGANFAFRRSTLEALGGFDHMLGAGATFSSAEDTDAQARALAAGWSGVYNPDIVVSHHHGRRAGAEVTHLARQYARGRGAYYVKALLSRQQRYVYAKNWYWAVRRQPWQISAREFAAGAEYFVRRTGRWIARR